jgi:2,6-dihydroxypseudooxynicotine hydrolase
MDEHEASSTLLAHLPESLGRFSMITRGRIEELNATISRVKNIDNWCTEFGKVANKYEVVAATTEDKEVKCEAHMLAAGYYHIAQLFILRDNDEKREVYRSIVSNYIAAMPYFANPTERVEVHFEDATLPGYFRKRDDIDKAPCVLIIGGADSSKEVGPHSNSEGFLARGLFTFTFDGPGQGETRFRGKLLRPDFEKAASAALDYLEKRFEVDSDRIGTFGTSLGGFLAPRLAAMDKRIKACVSLGGFYSLDEFEWRPEFRPRIENLMGIYGLEDWYRERKQYTLKGIIDKIECPLLVMNGSEDATIPVSQSIKIYEESGGPKELKIYEGAEHCASSVPESRTYYMDWMAGKLA